MPVLVKDLWVQGEKFWNRELLTQLFGESVANDITQVPIISADIPDDLCWTSHLKGAWIAASAYKVVLNERFIHHNLQQHVKELISIIWHRKNVFPKVQVFGWRVASRAIPTAVRVKKKKKKKELRTQMAYALDGTSSSFAPFVRAICFTSPFTINKDKSAFCSLNVAHMMHSLITTLQEDKDRSLFLNIQCLFGRVEIKNISTKETNVQTVMHQAKALISLQLT